MKDFPPWTTKSRERIFSRIRTNLGRAKIPAQSELDVVEAYIQGKSRGPLPQVESDLLGRFCNRASSMRMTTTVVNDAQAVPFEVARFIQAQGLPLKACIWPELMTYDWKVAGLSVEGRAARDGDAVGVTGAFSAIAETGTLMLLSGADTPSSVSLLPETHIAVVEEQRIVSHMEFAWELLRSHADAPPRAVNFVSGPSCTGDIEQTIVVGAHGPVRVHVLVVVDRDKC